MSRRSLIVRLRQRAGALAVDNFFRTAALAGKLHPRARPERHGIVVERNVSYLADGHRYHQLDLYRPRGAARPWPVVLYVHGGGFRILSKDTHWIMGLAFARAGFAVANISYRLAPQHRFPAAVEDCVAALCWLHAHADELGVDLGRLVLAGESAGANLVTTLALLSCYRRSEPFARAVFDSGVVPAAVMPFCGMLQVTDPARFKRRRPGLSTFIDDRLAEVADAYLGADPQRHGAMLDLADPLVLLERGELPDRPLPPWFAPVGTADPLLDDTRRLAAALGALGARCEVRYYPRQVHAFHALVWRKPARRCWTHAFRFLDREVPR